MVTPLSDARDTISFDIASADVSIRAAASLLLTSRGLKSRA
jgi:hypothetical protein